ncbi:MAG: hypothetical protein V4478_01385 [Patescibacteria group bacterium]
MMQDLLTEEKVDIFINPFLTIDPKIILGVQKVMDGKAASPEDNIIIPEYNFGIISKELGGEKVIVWNRWNSHTSIEGPIITDILQPGIWEEVFLWDRGSLRLEYDSGGSDCLFLIVGYDSGCDVTNIAQSKKFIKEIMRFLGKTFRKIIDGFIMLRYEQLYDSSLRIQRKPQAHLKRSDYPTQQTQ